MKGWRAFARALASIAVYCLAASASAQSPGLVLTPPEGQGRIDSALQDAGRRLRRNHLAEREKISFSCLIVSFEETLAEFPNGQREAWAILSAHLATASPRPGLPAKSFRYEEIYPRLYRTPEGEERLVSFLEQGRLPFEEDGQLGEVAEKFRWRARLNDGFREYLWEGAVSPLGAPDMETMQFWGEGSPDAPYRAESSPPADDPEGAWVHPFDLFETPDAQLRESFLVFAEAGRVPDTSAILWSAYPGTDDTMLDLHAYFPPPSLQAEESESAEEASLGLLTLAYLVEAGWPVHVVEHERAPGETEGSGSIRRQLSHHLGDAWASGSGAAIRFPRATYREDIFGTEGRRRVSRKAVLLAEFDRPEHFVHPALRPDALAEWLGVCLEWQNERGCLVSSEPEFHRESGVPRCELFETLRDQIDAGDLKLAWPVVEGSNAFAPLIPDQPIQK